MMSSLDNYKYIVDSIAAAAISAGRNPEDVSLVAVTKGQEWGAIASIYEGGQRDFGENRLAEAVEKMHAAPTDCRWHWIGALQKNKVRKVVGNFVLIHSVDTPELVRKISKVSVEVDVEAHILLQANMSGESSKHGCNADEWKVALGELVRLPNVSIDGMMTMAAADADEREARECFRKLRILRDELRSLSGGMLLLNELSMGMSRDFVWAIKEGATIVRVGSFLWDRTDRD